MKKILPLCIILFLILTSCVEKTSNSRKLKLLTKECSHLKGNTLAGDSTIWSSRIVCYFDNKLITRIYSADNIFTVYDCENDQIKTIGSFGREGNGPFELIEKSECYYDQESKLFYIINIINNIVKIYKIDLASLDNLFNINKWEELKFPQIERSFWENFIPLSDSTFIGLGGNYEKNNLLSMIHLKNEIMTELDIEFPQDKIDANLMIKRGVYNRGELLKKPLGNKFLYYCTSMGNYAEIVTLNEDLSISRKIIADDYPIYNMAPDGINSQSDMKTLMGMVSYVTDKYIYLLPNFRNKEKYLKGYNLEGYPIDHSENIFVYDWDGNFIKSYCLSKPIRYFVVDKNDSYIWGSCDDPEEEVVIIKFPLK